MEIKTLAEILAKQNTAVLSNHSKTSKKRHSLKMQETVSNDLSHPTKACDLQNSSKSLSKPSSDSFIELLPKAKKNPRKRVKTKVRTSYSKQSHQRMTQLNNINTSGDISQQGFITSSQSQVLNIKEILQEVHSEKSEIDDTNGSEPSATSNIDNITQKLQNSLKTAEQRQAEIDEIKSNSRLRWLAFYYLSTREHSSQELKDKLMAKNQNPEKIDELLAEFAEKGYQSDMRTALMLIRQGIRKGRGRNRIKQDFYKRKIDLPSNIDELIDLANEESEGFVEFVDKETEAINWIKLAIEARIKKYGEAIPTDHKEKAKQLRFLQYRGFKSDICFEAIRYNLQTFAER